MPAAATLIAVHALRFYSLSSNWSDQYPCGFVFRQIIAPLDLLAQLEEGEKKDPPRTMSSTGHYKGQLVAGCLHDMDVNIYRKEVSKESKKKEKKKTVGTVSMSS